MINNKRFETQRKSQFSKRVNIIGNRALWTLNTIQINLFNFSLSNPNNQEQSCIKDKICIKKTLKNKIPWYMYSIEFALKFSKNRVN